MAGEDLTVHDINVTERPDLSGKPGAMVKTVTFYVGTHGPFTKVYQPGQGVTSAIKADIQAQVSELRDLHQTMF